MSDPLTFDIVAELSGRNLPTDSITVYPDEVSAYRLSRLNKEISALSEGSDIPDELRDEHDSLKSKLRASALTFHLQGITRDETRGILREVDEAIPAEVNSFTGKAKPNTERDELYLSLTWASQITGIEKADGSKAQEVTPEVVSAIRGKLPVHESIRIQKAIEELADVTADGIDFIQEDTDFLSSLSLAE